MKKVIVVFILYLLINIIYSFMIGSFIFDIDTWNYISNIYVLVINFGAIIATVIVSKKVFATVNTRFIVRISFGLVYLVLLYMMVSRQVWMLK